MQVNIKKEIVKLNESKATKNNPFGVPTITYENVINKNKNLYNKYIKATLKNQGQDVGKLNIVFNRGKPNTVHIGSLTAKSGYGRNRAFFLVTPPIGMGKRFL